mmetsp:Transcript_3844/g.14290  ORF Transcript_3844/g.14290 Transcript_3844/m.14290 type:complete len:204 (-) Transcript_3844:423-1034(-)
MTRISHASTRALSDGAIAASASSTGDSDGSNSCTVDTRRDTSANASLAWCVGDRGDSESSASATSGNGKSCREVSPEPSSPSSTASNEGARERPRPGLRPCNARRFNSRRRTRRSDRDSVVAAMRQPRASRCASAVGRLPHSDESTSISAHMRNSVSSGNTWSAMRRSSKRLSPRHSCVCTTSRRSAVVSGMLSSSPSPATAN